MNLKDVAVYARSKETDRLTIDILVKPEGLRAAVRYRPDKYSEVYNAGAIMPWHTIDEMQEYAYEYFMSEINHLVKAIVYDTIQNDPL